MLDATKPEGVVTFTSIYEHLEVVEKCAPRGIHVMVEKPLAVSVDHAKRMIFLSKKYETLLLTNYETSYYPSVYELSEIIQEGKLGELRKIIVYDGHKGPKEINVNEEFLDWLRDPVLNGGGAVIDFGCYGANLITWLMNGKRPGSVYASLKTYKPDVYPEVDDDATIVLSYPEMECVIHASWNWPFSRKDMHVYGTNGYFLQDDQRNIRFRFDSNEKEQQMLVPPNKAPFTNAYSFFASAIQGDILIDPADLASTETNLTVVMILEAAIESSRINAEVSLSE
jgi:predicted dehydrogenase